MIEKIKEIIRNNKDVKISDIFANCDGKRKEVQGTLEELIENGDVIFKEGNYFLPSQLGLYKGIVVSVKKRFGFVACDELEDEILVDAQFLGNALLNDVVYLKNIGGTYYNVEKIIKRSRHEVVGEVCQLKKLTYLLVKGISTEDIIFKFDENEFENEAIVKCEIVSFDNNVIHVKGVKKLGDKNAPGIDITRILVENDCPIEFSDEVYAQVNNLPQEVSEEEIEGRLDLRDELIFTIDGEDARDLDDAVSVAPIEGGFRVGIHIADVSHYVEQYSPLDKEAYDRGTSIYVTDRVVPMLPFALSNGICSLNEGVDRLTISCIVDLDFKGNILASKIVPSVINSKHRLTYTYVNQVIENADKSNELNKAIMLLDAVAKSLRKNKHERGCLAISAGEIKVLVDERGTPIDIVKKYQGEGEKLIEDLMILANEVVAETFAKRQLPFVYRIHENPAAKKVDNLIAFLSRLGLEAPFTALSVNPQLVQELLEKVHGLKEEEIISQVVLRSLAKARYATNNKGHFGLASKCYTHFTSPIRRYPDLTVHRLIRRFLFECDLKKANNIIDELTFIAENSSIKERRAISVEREATDMKCAEYMSNHIGEEFEGFISGMNNSGLFVELDNGVSGKLNFTQMSDYYYIDSLAQSCVGKRKGSHFMLGDRVKVLIDSTNKDAGEISLLLVNEIRVKRSNKKRKKNR